MIDGGTLKRHFSDLVSATATKNQSDVTLIDPFQLIDFKTRILPEHLYPKFRLQLDKFKTQNPHVDITEVPDDYSQDQADDDHPPDLTGDQRVDRAMENDNPSGADALLRKMVETSDTCLLSSGDYMYNLNTTPIRKSCKLFDFSKLFSTILQKHISTILQIFKYNFQIWTT